MKKKTHNLLFVLLIGIFMMTSLTACGNKSNVELVKEPMETSNQANNKKKPKPLVEFANALCDENYDAILQMSYLPENSIITKTDIETFLKESNLQNFLGAEAILVDKYQDKKGILTGIIQNNQGDIANVQFLQNGDTYQLTLPNLYVEMNILAPKNTTISIQGKTVNQKLATEYEDSYYDLTFDSYQLICPTNEFQITVESNITTYEIPVCYNEEQTTPYYLFNTELNKKLLDKTADETKNVFNQFLSALCNKQDITPYFTEDISAEYIQEIHAWYDYWKTTTNNPQLTVVEPTTSDDYISAILDNNTIQIYCKVENTWNAGDTSHLFSYFVMQLDHGTYKIKEAQLIGNTFFTNRFQSMW